MTACVRCLVLAGTYHDSVALLALARTLEQRPDVQQAAVLMGAAQNKMVLHEAGLLTAEGEAAGANDLILCVQALTSEAAEQALTEARQRLLHRQAAAGEASDTAPRTLETALRRLPEANLACISVPGQYAAHEARKALQHGLHVFLFSDHVSLEDEAELKQLAAQRGLLVMGPDCGTAILGGVPLGFANQVGRGPVGVIAASGTGLQHVLCLLAEQGIGVSQAIGVGGRDMHGRIGGRSMEAALQALARDPETRVIVLISKPAATEVAARLVQAAAQSGKPCILALLGALEPAAAVSSLYPVPTLEDAALVAGALIRGEPVETAVRLLSQPLAATAAAARAALPVDRFTVRAFYCGGTLAYEALWLLRELLGKVVSNLDGTYAAAGAGEHVVLDLGAEEFTAGRPHPMIDPAIRRQQLLKLASQPDVAVVLCDIILGWGAHADPAAAWIEAWTEMQRQRGGGAWQPFGIVTVCGSPNDPQGYERQCQMLRQHGFLLTTSNARAVRLAATIVGNDSAAECPLPIVDRPAMPYEPAPTEDAAEFPALLPQVFAAGPRVVNIGLEWFAQQLTACGVPVVHVDWRPPAGGDRRLADILQRLR